MLCPAHCKVVFSPIQKVLDRVRNLEVFTLQVELLRELEKFMSVYVHHRWAIIRTVTDNSHTVGRICSRSLTIHTKTKSQRACAAGKRNTLHGKQWVPGGYVWQASITCWNSGLFHLLDSSRQFCVMLGIYVEERKARNGSARKGNRISRIDHLDFHSLHAVPILVFFFGSVFLDLIFDEECMVFLYIAFRGWEFHSLRANLNKPLVVSGTSSIQCIS